jgi:predicted nucleic acid-binding protein
VAITAWLKQPIVAVLDPGEQYWEILGKVLTEAQAVGPLVMDAALAALAMEHGATLYSTDRDFLRFSGLKWRNPLA